MTSDYAKATEDTRAPGAPSAIGQFAILVVPSKTLGAVQDDPDDNRVLQCAVVSGDLDLLCLGSFQGIVVLRVAEFLAEFERGSGR
jgi:predicted nucleic acid-binding protein